MKKEYDFSKGKRGYYNEKMERGKITIRLDEDVIDYFKKMAEKKGVPYQTLINLYLRNCKNNKLEVDLEWKKQA
jgi:predicted DNA binding CopG/RHH family protein